MYTIFTAPGTGAFAVEAMLEAGSAKWQRHITDTSRGEHKTAEFLALNPAGQVPALKLPSGEMMSESAAMCLYLGDAFPETGLAPAVSDPARAAYLRWMVYLSAVVYEADLRHFYGDRYTTDPAGAGAVKQRAKQQMDDAFAILDARLASTAWLAGEHMSAADIYMAMLASWHPDVAGLKKACPRLAAACAKVAELDYVQRANAFHKLW